MNKSKAMRNYFVENDGDVTISDIANEVNVRYAFAYQVIRRFCDDSDYEMPTNEGGVTKADKIRNLYDDGLTIGEIAKQLNTNYSYCWSVVDEYRE